MDAIDVLMNEHQNIKKLVACVRSLCMEVLQGKSVPSSELQEFIFLARNYADKHHHGKEELILFRELQKLADKQVQDIIQFGMLFDHDQGRTHIMELEMALKHYEKTDDDRIKLDIVTHAGGWANVLEKHMTKEDNAVYRLARMVLSKDVLALVENESAAFEEEHRVSRDAALERLSALCTRCGVSDK